MENKRLYQLFALYGEVLAALGGALALTLALSLAVTVGLVLLFPVGPQRGEAALEPAPGEQPAADARSSLLEQLRRAGIAERVEVAEAPAGAARLVLRGVGSREAASGAVAAALSAGGFRSVPLRFRPELDPAALVREPAIFLPGLAIQVVVFLAIGGILARWRVRPQRPGQGALPALGIGLAGGAAAFAVSVGLSLLLERLGWPVQEQQLLVDLLGDPANVLLLAPWVVLAAPVAEEVFFRGYLFRFVTQGAGLPAGFLISSCLFAAVHLNLSGFPVYVAVGCVFAAVYLRSSRLLSPITAHVTYNGVLMAAIGLGWT